MRNFIAGLISFILFALISAVAGVGAAIVIQLMYSLNMFAGIVTFIIVAVVLSIVIYKIVS